MILDRVLDDWKVALIRGISNALDEDVFNLVFAHWLTPEVATNFEPNAAITEILSTEKRTYRQSAALGFLAHMGTLDEAAITVLAVDLEHLFGRESIVAGTPMPFCMDGAALVGIMLGTHAANTASLLKLAIDWFAQCANATSAGKGLEEWQEWFLRVVGEHVSIQWHGHRPLSIVSAVVSVGLRSKGVGPQVLGDAQETEEENALQGIQSESSLNLPLGYAVVCLAALNWIRRLRPVADLRTATASGLIQVLRRLPHGLQHWTWEDKPRTRTSVAARKWNVDNEYHVQNILWLLLAPLFPDLVWEDYSAKVGPVQPRLDIGVPSLRLIVEAKFMRSGDTPKNIIEQIAADASLYLVSGSKYDHMIPFIWDDSRRSEDHEEMLRGLKQIRGVMDAVIVSRPGSMV